ncbi:MAG TPA: AI-2E family transporter [Euzebyales bacterium]|nr:AI-2E family transporter [Euzebyales bacterium]
MPTTMSAAPGRVQRAAYRVWLAVGAVVLAWIAWRVLARPVAVVLPPLLLTTVIVYLLAPIVGALADRGLPRWLGTLLAYIGGLLALSLVVAVLVPMINEQLRTFVDALPELLTKLGEDLERRLAPLGISVPVGDTVNPDAVARSMERVLEGGGVSAAAGVIGGLSGLALGLLQVVIVFTLGPVVAFYLLVDLPRLGRWVRSLIPPQHREEAAVVGAKLHHVVGGFIRGQLLVALFVGLATSLGLAVVGLPYWLLVGVTAGVANIIPLLGPFVAGTLGVSIALVTDGVGLALLVLVVMLLVQQVDNQLISPLVMGRNVHVHPLAVLLALVIAGTVYGLLGLLIAVPSVAAGNVLATHFWRSRVPWAEDPDDPATPPPGADPATSDVPPLDAGPGAPRSQRRGGRTPPPAGTGPRDVPEQRAADHPGEAERVPLRPRGQ